ncbi:MAG: hypothetical protein HZA34_03415 [Candidatus Pacebacteria bacterium]|nr:hypothetical protein [Candidatus Paceibacterota bacterium]
MPTAAAKHRQTYLRKTIFTLIPIILLTVSIFIGVSNLSTIRDLFIGASGEEANISIDTQAILGPMPRPWRNLAQGGEDKDWRLQPLVAQVKALQPEYIRIDHIYDFFDIVSRGGNGGLQYNWTKMDAVVTDILNTGAKPYIALSYTPSVLAPSGDIVGQPSNWNEYQQVIQRTVEHFSKDRGIENVAYEVWNEPDLFGKWRIGSSKNYLTLYTYASRGAQQAAANGAKTFTFGGPATTGLYKNWITELLDHVSKNNLRLDFLSWHRYARDIDAYRRDFRDIQNWVASFPQFANVEFHITEWGHDSEVDFGYDGIFGAAHTAAVATEMVGQIQRGFVFEIQDGKGPEGKEYWGRWGLFTHKDFGAKVKPRYRALRMIDGIGNQRLPILGKGSWVKGMAARSGDTTTVVLANYDPAGKHNENVPVTFRNVVGSRFVVDQQFLDGRNDRQEVSTTSAELRIVIPMTVNSVASIRLIPLESQVVTPAAEITATSPATP